MIPKRSSLWLYRPGYQLIVFFVSFVAPLVAISYSYTFMFRMAHKRPTTTSADRKRKNVDMKTIKTIAVIVVVFVICWFPFFVLVLFNGFCACVGNQHVLALTMFMHHTNSSLNPIIYVWYSKQFRQAFLTALNKFAHNNTEAEFLIRWLKKNEKRLGREEERVNIVLLRL